MSPPPPSRPEDLIAQARAGDRAALEALLEGLRDQLAHRVRARAGRSVRALLRTSDLLQSVYLDVVRSIRHFEGGSEKAFAGWVTRILENNIRDKHRRFAARKREAGRTELVAQECLSDRTSLGLEPAARALMADDLRLVIDALYRLAADHRHVIMLRLVEGRGYDEIAKALGRSETAVRILLVRARASLLLEMERTQLRREGHPTEPGTPSP